MKLKKTDVFLIKNDDDCKKAARMLEHTSDEDRLDEECAEVFEIIKKLIDSYDKSQPQLISLI